VGQWCPSTSFLDKERAKCGQGDHDDRDTRLYHLPVKSPDRIQITAIAKSGDSNECNDHHCERKAKRNPKKDLRPGLNLHSLEDEYGYGKDYMPGSASDHLIGCFICFE